MILVDTTVWIDHLHKGVPELAKLLGDEKVLCHPMVLGELACGSIKNREEVFGLLGKLPLATVATNEEASAFIERQSLAGRGLGFIDVHLLVSTILTPECRLWTRDRRLRAIAEPLELAFAEQKRS